MSSEEDKGCRMSTEGNLLMNEILASWITNSPVGQESLEGTGFTPAKFRRCLVELVNTDHFRMHHHDDDTFELIPHTPDPRDPPPLADNPIRFVSLAADKPH